MATRYVVRDVRTKGVDYLLWGDDDPVGAQASLIEAQAQFGEAAIELVTMPAQAMDDHTRMLIEGEPDPPWVRKLKALGDPSHADVHARPARRSTRPL